MSSLRYMGLLGKVTFSYVAPATSAANFKFNTGYSTPDYDAVNFKWINASGAADLSIGSQSSLSFVAQAIAKTQTSIESAATLNIETPDRTLSISGSTQISLINPDRAFTSATETAMLIEVLSVSNAVVSGTGSTTLNLAAKAVSNGAPSLSSTTVFGAINSSIGNGRFRSNNKTTITSVPQFHKISAFHSSSKTTVVTKTRQYGDIRIRGRSRTIMRIRSAPWPW